jgi:hypothetical protein
MQNIKTRESNLLALAIFTFLFLTNPLYARTLETKKPLSEYLEECPWTGLVADYITLGPIKISKVSIHHGDNIAYVLPGQTIHGKLKFEIESDDLELLHLYHLTVGFKGQGAQDCVTHNLGMWDSKGSGEFTLEAPEAPGVYEVRFLLTEGLTCAGAYEAWDSDHGTPSSAATIGILIVQ